MLQWWQIQDGKLKSCAAGEGSVTVYINPDEAERKYLIHDLKADEHTLTSALDPDELARVEFEPERLGVLGVAVGQNDDLCRPRPRPWPTPSTRRRR